MDLNLIYKRLFKEYGPQGWWPLFKNGEFIYDKDNKNKKINEYDAFVISLGAILTQNTSWNNAEKAIVNLWKNNLLDIKKINEISADELGLFIKSAGFYNQKARTIKNFVDFLFKEFEGKFKNLFLLNSIELREGILNMKGIGFETADSIMLYAGNKEIFVIDGYTKRIMKRYGIDLKYNELQKYFMSNLKRDYKIYNEFHALLVKKGKNLS